MQLQDIYPTYEQCVELAKYRKRGAFANWRISNRQTFEIEIEYYWISDSPICDAQLYAPSVPEMELEIYELCEKHKAISPKIVYLGEVYAQNGYFSWFTEYDDAIFIGSTMAQAYATVLLNLLKEHEPLPK